MHNIKREKNGDRTNNLQQKKSEPEKMMLNGEHAKDGHLSEEQLVST